MIYPALSELIDKVGSRYSLVVATAKRARELVDGDSILIETENTKPVSIAVREIYEDKLEINDNPTAPQETVEIEGFEPFKDDFYA